MILQEFIFPSYTFNPVVSAFMRLSKGIQYQIGEKSLNIPMGGRVDFDTYFNGFSIAKWEKYTSIRNPRFRLHLKGSFTVILINSFRNNGTTIHNELKRMETVSDVTDTSHKSVSLEAIDSSEVLPEEDNKYVKTYLSESKWIEVEIPSGLRGICSISLIARQDEACFLGGDIYADEPESIIQPHIAIDICTYHRESYVHKNMSMLEKTIFASDSPMRNNFEIFIADNGRSLTLNNDCNGRIHVYPNKNAGGAGGFGRGMIEILRSPHYRQFTHVLLMDDDIVFSEETLKRTWVFLSMLLPDYTDAFIGGAMLSIESPKIQTEAFERWHGTGNQPLKYRYDITSRDFVVKNEQEDKGNHFGWWYCVMPISVVKANNLPLPLFIKRDDIEYGLRNGHHFINLNGICVLHSDFGTKRRGFLDYYYWRNQCIINAIHWPSYGKKQIKAQLRDQVFLALSRYRYNDANLAFVGVEDFLRGVDWLKATDPENLNASLMEYTYKPCPVRELPGVAFNHGLYEKQVIDTKKGASFPREATRRMKALIGQWVRPAKGICYVSMVSPAYARIRRAKHVINYDETSDTAFVTHKSFRCAINLLWNYWRITRLINRYYEATSREFRFRFRELTSLLFWDQYLELDRQRDEVQYQDIPVEITSCIRNEKTLLKSIDDTKRYRMDRLRLWKVRMMRFMQRFLFMVPYRKNSVFIYLHARRGYTCNPKYILEELIRRYGNRIKIDWLSDWPEAVSALSQGGIRVLRLNSFEHWWRQFTARVIITNDSFPLQVRLRKGQLTINTWHAGMNYKHIGPEFCHFKNKAKAKMFAIANTPPNVYLSGSRYFTEDTSKSFRFPQSLFIPTGLARNDIFFHDCKILSNTIRMRYALPKAAKLVLYAPTFREEYGENMFNLDLDKLRTALSNRFGGDWYVLYRRHYFVQGKKALLDAATVDVSDYDDMNELLAVVDILVSDYSSCLWDFALTRRPSFVYAPDMDSYATNDRTFSYPPENWPYPIAKNNDELEVAIRIFNPKEYEQRISKHLKAMGSYDTGHASEKAADIIAKKLML